MRKVMCWLLKTTKKGDTKSETSMMKLYCKNSQQIKALTIVAKSSILYFRLGSEYVCKRPLKLNWLGNFVCLFAYIKWIFMLFTVDRKVSSHMTVERYLISVCFNHVNMNNVRWDCLISIMLLIKWRNQDRFVSILKHYCNGSALVNAHKSVLFLIVAKKPFL